MKYTESASIGFLPMIANRTAKVTTVSATAISGEATAITVERSARRSSTNCMLCLSLVRRPLGVRAAHQQSELLARRFGRFERRRQPAVEHHRNAVMFHGR